MHINKKVVRTFTQLSVFVALSFCFLFEAYGKCVIYLKSVENSRPELVNKIYDDLGVHSSLKICSGQNNTDSYYVLSPISNVADQDIRFYTETKIYKSDKKDQIKQFSYHEKPSSLLTVDTYMCLVGELCGSYESDHYVQVTGASIGVFKALVGLVDLILDRRAWKENRINLEHIPPEDGLNDLKYLYKNLPPFHKPNYVLIKLELIEEQHTGFFKHYSIYVKTVDNKFYNLVIDFRSSKPVIVGFFELIP